MGQIYLVLRERMSSRLSSVDIECDLLFFLGSIDGLGAADGRRGWFPVWRRCRRAQGGGRKNALQLRRGFGRVGGSLQQIGVYDTVNPRQV